MKNKSQCSKTLYVGIDNGVTGSIGLIVEELGKVIWAESIKTPIIKRRNYTKENKYINCIDYKEVAKTIDKYKADCVHVAVERPMVNPGRFFQTLSAMRSLEATEVAIGISSNVESFCYVDSKDWQSDILPGVEGNDLKPESWIIGISLYNQILGKYSGNDCDGLLIADWLMKGVKKSRGFSLSNVTKISV